MTETKNFASLVTVKLAVSVKYKVLEGTLAVFQMRRGLAPGQKLPEQIQGSVSSGTTEGFARLKAIKDFEAGKATTIEQLEDFYLAHPDILSLMRIHGYSNAAEHLPKNQGACDLKPFTAFSKGKASLDQVVRFDTGADMVFDRHGKVLPTAIYFDYSSGMVRNGCYDLERAVAILKKDSRVRLIESKTGGYIHEVPYYNRSPSCALGLVFYFTPTAEEVQQMWVEQKKLNKTYPSTCEHEAIFKLDLLKLRSGKAAKYKTYWEWDKESPSDPYED